MNYVVFKILNRKEYRIYVENTKYEGLLIYKGHKLGIELSLLSQLIDFRIEKSSNKISILNYEKAKDRVDHLNKDHWFIGTSDSVGKLLMESWESIQKVLEEKCGKFRKILITEVNI